MTFEKDTIGVVGHGFVGEALEKGMKHAVEVLVCDPYKYPDPEAVDDVEIVATPAELAQRAEIIFVAVPTPMNLDGSSCTKIVDSVVAGLAEHKQNNIVVIKSTVPPGTTKRLHDQFAGNGLAGVVFNPEFLTEANYLEDFKNQTRIILGCETDAVKTKVKRLYQKAYPKVPTVKTNPTIAEMVKYTTNCFLATKLSFANELYQICEALDIDYDKVVEYFLYDERIGKSHWAVPGPDGQMGWGLSCFPKDLNAMIAVAKDLNVSPKMMSAAWRKNLEVREDRDWERMKKAVVTPTEMHSQVYHWSRAPGKFVNKLTGEEIGLSSSIGSVGPTFQGTVREWYETLVETIIDMSKFLGYDRFDDTASIHIEVGSEILTILEASVGYRPHIDANGKSKFGEIHQNGTQVGTLVNRINIIKDELPEQNMVYVYVKDGNEHIHAGKVKVLDLGII